MIEIKLSKGKVAMVDDEDYERINKFKWFTYEKLYLKCSSYAMTNIRISGKRRHLQMHRFIMNTPENLQVDHIDHNGLNNQKSNLRNCTRQQNNFNSRSQKGNYKGVFIDKKNKKNPFRARIRHNTKEIYIGSFKTAKEAGFAYDNKAKELFKEFAHLNFK